MLGGRSSSVDGRADARTAMMTLQRRYSARWMIVYVASLVFVCSFVLFEVLDIDGSDFSVPPRTELTIKLTEPSDDIHRGSPELAALPAIAPPAAAAIALHWLERLAQAACLTDSGAALVCSRDSRTTLPRASLDSRPSTL